MKAIELRKLVQRIATPSLKKTISIIVDHIERLEDRLDGVPAASKRADEVKLEDIEKQIAELRSELEDVERRLRWVETGDTSEEALALDKIACNFHENLSNGEALEGEDPQPLPDETPESEEERESEAEAPAERDEPLSPRH